MKIYSALLLCTFFISCNNARDKDIHKAKIQKAGTVTVNEDVEVLKEMPHSMSVSSDSLLTCVLDNKVIATYNINTGRILREVSIDSILRQPNFNIPDVVRTNKLNIIPNRTYLTDLAQITDLGLPVYKLIKVAPFSSFDSVDILVYVLTPFANGNTVTADYSLVYLNVNLNKQTINKQTYVRMELIENVPPEKLPGFVNPELGCLIHHNVIYSTLLPDYMNKRGNLVAIFDCNKTPQQAYTDPHKYQQEAFQNISDWFCKMNYQVDENGNILCNDIFNIFQIGGSKEKGVEISLKDKMKINKFEHLVSFYKIHENEFLIQTVIRDSINSTTDFRFYNPETYEMGISQLQKNIDSISSNVIFSSDKIIFFSKDEEHYYIETYKIVYP